MSAIERIRESLLHDPDWDDCDVGEAQRVLPALIAVAEAADRLARPERYDEPGSLQQALYALRRALAALDAGGGR